MDINEYIGSRIKHFRDINNMNQGVLAEQLGTTKQTVSRYERGQRKTDQDTLFRLSDIFDAKIDEFFPQTEQGYPALEQLENLKNSNDLSVEEMDFFKQLAEKTLSMNDEERGKLLEHLRFTVDYFTKTNEDN